MFVSDIDIIKIERKYLYIALKVARKTEFQTIAQAQIDVEE